MSLIEQLRKFVAFEREALPDKTHIADWALREIESLTAERDALKQEVAEANIEAVHWKNSWGVEANKADALEADSERLDWLESTKRPAEIYVDGVPHGCYHYGIASATNHTLRAAIDAMRVKS